ncbi:3-hydroxy-3-methylglutaryl-coenzyme A (HMG-CoA) reductase isozyme, partial [Ascosphaera acerosa]
AQLNPTHLSLATMRATALLPRRLLFAIAGAERESTPSSPTELGSADDDGEPSWLNARVTQVMNAAADRVCLHPIQTIVVTALLASTTYIGLLEGSLAENVRSVAPGTISVEKLLEGGRDLRVGQSTGWEWVAEPNGGSAVAGIDPDGAGGGNHRYEAQPASHSHSHDRQARNPSDRLRSASHLTPRSQDVTHLALATFIFPGSSSPSSAGVSGDAIRFPENVSVSAIPATPNLFAPISQDSSLAFTLPYEQIGSFLKAVQEVPSTESEKEGEQKRWIMQAARSSTYGSRRAIRLWIYDAYSSFVDLITHAETIDITIITLGYVAMHLTFISLFTSMRQLGSNFWLAATVLFNGMIAFLFALITTTKLGVPISLKLLSEGLPFLVVAIGFEKPISLTRAVLAASVEQQNSSRKIKNHDAIRGAIHTAIERKGFKIFLDYVIGICVLSAGAASGVQGGLRQFCFLSAWVLFFDGILLFTFYTTILCLKLEINRIKRHVALRRALEEEGVTHHVAENVATINDKGYQSDDSESKSSGSGSGIIRRGLLSGLFGSRIRSTSITKFKALMVGGFVVVNVVNVCTIPFRSYGTGLLSPALAKMSGLLFSKSIDPFKVAERGLDVVLASARDTQTETAVTVLAPIKYALEYPSVHYHDARGFQIEYSDQLLDLVGGKVIESMLKSLDDPVISKWIIAALTLSVALNGYLFNAARWSLKEPATSQVVTIREPKKVSVEEDRAKIQRRQQVSQHTGPLRSQEECEKLHREKLTPYLQDEEIIDLAVRGKLPGYALEKTMERPESTRLEAFTRAVKIRRAMVARNPETRHITGSLEKSKLPYKDYNYTLVHGACCENVVGYLPLPLGLAGPMRIDGRDYYIPMATTEGVLVASANRGCKAINAGGGCTTILTGDGMTRGPCVSFPSLSRAGAAKAWLDSEEGQAVMKDAFNSTSRFARLQHMKTNLAGTNLYIRFKTTTGDAMGMNMISKGVEKALAVMANEAGFDDMETISVSGNFCMDKKPAAINWIDGRGKSVVAEAIVPGHIVKSVLKSDVDTMVKLNVSKNLVGSAMSGSIGGFNAQASNLVTAIFIATGQDPAQNVESSNCITLMDNVAGDLHITVSMPSVEVGTIGGGTILEAQGAMLDLLGVRGAHPTHPGENARQLARIVAAAVLAGELSLCGALAAGHLVRAHMAHNRSTVPTRSATPVNNRSKSNN